MIQYLADIIPKIQKFSKKLDELVILTEQKWVLINNNGEKKVFIFRSNGELLISTNGVIEKGKWEHVIKNTLTIKYSKQQYLYELRFLDECILALKQDGINEPLIFGNEIKIGEKFNSGAGLIEYVKSKYLGNQNVNLNDNKINTLLPYTIVEETSENLNPSIDKFDSDKFSVRLGDSIKLIWATKNADKVELIPVGKVSNSGNLIFKCDNEYAKEYLFELRVYNKTGKITDSSKLCIYIDSYQSIKPQGKVSNPLQNDIDIKKLQSKAIIEKFDCDLYEIRKGDVIKLNWKTQNASRTEILPFGQVESNGSCSYKITSTTSNQLMVELKVYNSDGVLTDNSKLCIYIIN